MEVARRALIPLSENEQESCAPARGRGQAHSPVLISCSSFCHRSPKQKTLSPARALLRELGVREGRRGEG